MRSVGVAAKRAPNAAPPYPTRLYVLKASFRCSSLVLRGRIACSIERKEPVSEPVAPMLPMKAARKIRGRTGTLANVTPERIMRVPKMRSVRLLPNLSARKMTATIASAVPRRVAVRTKPIDDE